MRPTLRALAALAAAAISVLTRAATQSPVFCSDVGLAFEFPKSSNGDTHEREPLASSCLRHPAMNAVSTHLTARLDSLAVSAVDCVREAAYARFAVLSLCSRSNVQHTAVDARAWDADVRALVDDVLGARVATASAASAAESATAAPRWFPRKVQLSPAYALPDGKGMPRFEFRGARIVLDPASKAVRVELAVRNAGKVPLHLYRAVVTESVPSGVDGGDATDPTAVLVELPTVAAVGAGKASMVVFTSSGASPLAIAPSKRYVVYITHSGFRAHRFEGVVSSDGVFVPTSAVLSAAEKGSDELFGAALSTTSGMDPLLAAFPLGSWRGIPVELREWMRTVSGYECVVSSFQSSHLSLRLSLSFCCSCLLSVRSVVCRDRRGGWARCCALRPPALAPHAPSRCLAVSPAVDEAVEGL